MGDLTAVAGYEPLQAFGVMIPQPADIVLDLHDYKPIRPDFHEMSGSRKIRFVFTPELGLDPMDVVPRNVEPAIVNALDAHGSSHRVAFAPYPRQVAAASQGHVPRPLVMATP